MNTFDKNYFSMVIGKKKSYYERSPLKYYLRRLEGLNLKKLILKRKIRKQS